MWVNCSFCEADREIEALEDGCCVVCGNPVTNAPEDVTNVPKPVTTPKIHGNSAAAKALKAPIQTDVIDKEVREQPYDAPRPEILSAIQAKARRVLSRRRLMQFIKRFRPKYDAGWVHEDICRRLERFVQQVELGQSPRLLLMMPPRGGKSEIGSRHFPAWVLGHHPEWEIIAASHTSSLTMSFSRYVRDLLRDPVYQEMFPNTSLDPSSQSIENWNLISGGGYLAAGVGTGITGRGAHILLLDDLVKDIEAADSTTIRDNTWEWYGSTAYTRLAPGAGVLGIMTWWHEDDWAGRIQQVMEAGEGDKFEIVRYPAINDEGDEYILADDTIVQLTELEEVPEGARMTREKGTALHPARYTTEMMLRIRANLFASGQQRVWNALYQQNPLPDDGLMFTRDMFRYDAVPPERARCRCYQAWDFAITENKTSDYTVGVTLFHDERDILHVVDVRRFKSGDSFIIVDEILNYAEEWKVDVIGFEDGQIWKAMEAVFDRRCQERRQYPAREILKPLTDKLARASPLRGRMQLGRVYFDNTAPWFRDMFLELTRFPSAKHDDQVDALAWAVRLSLTQSAPLPLASKKQRPLKSWRDRLKNYTNTGDHGHMSA